MVRSGLEHGGEIADPRVELEVALHVAEVAADQPNGCPGIAPRKGFDQLHMFVVRVLGGMRGLVHQRNEGAARAQVCQQLLVTGYDFAWVQAKLFRTDATYSRGDNSHLPETYEKSFFISRQDPSVIQSLPVIEDAHTEFWACVTEGRMPWSTIR